MKVWRLLLTIVQFRKLPSPADRQQLVPYLRNAEYLEQHDPHAVYPTSIYRQSTGHVWSNEDCSYIEGVMGTTITTTIKIQSSVLSPSNLELRNISRLADV